MKQINALSELSPMLTAQWKKGVMTNAAFSAERFRSEIENGTLYVQEIPDGLLLFRKRDGFYRLNFYLQPEADLSGLLFPGDTVMEIASRPQDTSLKCAERMWQQKGFAFLFGRTRVAWTEPYETLSLNPAYTIRPALQSDADAAMQLLLDRFSVRTACLPNFQELRSDIETGNLWLAVTPQNEVIGVLHTVSEKKSVQVRHIAVSQSHKKQGVATQLLCALRQRTDGKIFLWVSDNNTPARQLYDKLGFTTENWTSTVWSYNMERN